MHEMGIAMQIVDIATEALPDDIPNVSVEKVNLKIGKLAAVIPSSLRFCYEIITRETPLQGSVLEIEEIPVVARCRTCLFEWTVHKPDFICTQCQSGTVDIITGRELDIVSIEVAEGNRDAFQAKI